MVHELLGIDNNRVNVLDASKQKQAGFSEPLRGSLMGFLINFHCFPHCSPWSSHQVPMYSFSKTCMPTTVSEVNVEIDPYYFTPS